MIKFLPFIFISFIFSGCFSHNQYTIVQEGNKDGVIDDSGYVVVKPIYKHIFEFDGESTPLQHPHLLNLHWLNSKDGTAYAIVQATNNKFGIINKDGKLLLKPIYDSITYFFNGFLKVEIGGKFGLVDENFKIILKPTYDSIDDFIDNVAIVSQNNKYGCINKDIQLKVKPIYDRIYFQQEGFLRTKLKDKWGYLDNQCNVLVKPIFDYAYNFSNGFAKVILKGRVSYIQTDGKLISKQIFTKESAAF